MPYEISKQRKSLGSALPIDGVGVPQGVSLSTQLAEMLSDLVGSLGLPEMGVLTPWATRKGDLQWQEINKPDTNIATFRIDDAGIQAAQQMVLFGQRLPFVTVLTGQLQTTTELEKILDGSMYELYETQAVYRQDDSDDIPNVLFLHWLRVLPEDQMPRSIKSMGTVASEMHGQLLYSQQVPVESSTLRAPPGVTFAQAFGVQEPDPLFQPTVLPAPAVTQPTTSAPADLQPSSSAQVKAGGGMLVPLLIGVVSAVSTAYVVKRWVK